MQFNSYLFVFLFLIVVIAAYYICNKINTKLGKFAIIAASVVFYSYGRINMLLYLGISVLINYIAAFFITGNKNGRQKKAFLALPIVINVALLLYFKYFNFGISNLNSAFGTSFALKEIVLPLGISFYTFQQIAYVVSIYRGDVSELSLVDYLAYILYFPKILMGPLMEPSDFIEQFNDEKRKEFDVDNLTYGIKVFSLGLLKKGLIADTFSVCVAWGYDNFSEATALDFILIMLFYTFEIYFDFSGYTDMAVGVSKMLGIDLPMNFDSPYKAISIRDFWKRWHMSLTKFFTRYIYIPLGGSRKGELFTYLNTMIIFIISGFWHGSNWTFVLWGTIHGLFMVLDRVLEKNKINIFKPIRWLFTFGIVNVLWLLFSAESIGQWWTMLVKMAHIRDFSVSKGLLEKLQGPECTILREMLRLDNVEDYKFGRLFALVVIMITMAICLIPENNHRNMKKLNIPSMVLAAAAFVWGVLCLGGESTFVYFGF